MFTGFLAGTMCLQGLNNGMETRLEDSFTSVHNTYFIAIAYCMGVSEYSI